MKRSTMYPDGKPIPEALPAAYQKGTLEKNCSNCNHVMYITNNEYQCGRFSGNPAVRPDWVCAVWEPVNKNK